MIARADDNINSVGDRRSLLERLVFFHTSLFPCLIFCRYHLAIFVSVFRFKRSSGNRALHVDMTKAKTKTTYSFQRRCKMLGNRLAFFEQPKNVIPMFVRLSIK